VNVGGDEPRGAAAAGSASPAACARSAIARGC
jgi:hypothetical protein